MPKTIEVRVPCDNELRRKEGIGHYYVVHSGGAWMAHVEDLYTIAHSPMHLHDISVALRNIGAPTACSKATNGVFEGVDNWKFIANDWREWLAKMVSREIDSTFVTIENTRNT